MANSEGTDAIIACGTTGEAPTLSDDEHKLVINIALMLLQAVYLL